MNKKKSAFNTKMFLLFLVLLVLTIISYIIFDRENIKKSGYDIGEKVEDFSFGLIDTGWDISYGVDNMINGGSKDKIVGGKKEEKKITEKDYDISDISSIDIGAASIDCEIIPSDKKKINVKALKLDKRVGNLDDFKEGSRLRIFSDGNSSIEVTIEIPEESDIDLSLSGASISLENKCVLKGLDINGTSIDLSSNTKKSYDIDLNSTSIDADIVVRENNFEFVASGMSIDYSFPDEDGSVVGGMARKFGNSEHKLEFNALSIDIDLDEE